MAISAKMTSTVLVWGNLNTVFLQSIKSAILFMWLLGHFHKIGGEHLIVRLKLLCMTHLSIQRYYTMPVDNVTRNVYRRRCGVLKITLGGVIQEPQLSFNTKEENIPVYGGFQERHNVNVSLDLTQGLSSVMLSEKD